MNEIEQEVKLRNGVNFQFIWGANSQKSKWSGFRHVVDTCENETATNSKFVIVQEFSIRISMFTYMWCHLRIKNQNYVATAKFF